MLLDGISASMFREMSPKTLDNALNNQSSSISFVRSLIENFRADQVTRGTETFAGAMYDKKLFNDFFTGLETQDEGLDEILKKISQVEKKLKEE
ncbi:MAG: hypothetical protein PHG97_02500 [Candidatus Margulisbacteria bacterium]|nr:hypothetical protein [Candidatus Margulisiibacteriota bacterium]